MQLELLVNAAFTGAGLLGLLAFYVVMFEPMMAEAFVSRLDAIGAELDVLVAEGATSEGSRPVVHLRGVLDALRSSSHSLTLPRLILATVLVERHARLGCKVPEFTDLLKDVSSARVRRLLWTMHRDIQLEMVRHVCTNTPLGWMLVVSTYPIYLVEVGTTKLRTFDQVLRKLLNTTRGPVTALEQQVYFETDCSVPA